MVRAVSLDELPCDQQHELHRDAKGLYQSRDDVEQQRLRPVSSRVVPDDQQLALRSAHERLEDCACGGVEVGPPVMGVRLQIGAFRPLVPGVHEHQRLARHGMSLRVPDRLAQPLLVRLG